MIQEYLEYLEKMTVATKRRGASAAVVDQLEGACGSALPQDYREYLLEFGEDRGDITIGDDCWTTVRALLEHYADPLMMESTPRNCVVISTGGLSDPRMIDCSGTEADGQVWTFDVDEPQGVSESFRNLLYQSAWTHVRFVAATTEAMQAHWQAPVRVAEVEQAMLEIGLNICPFSDDFNACGEDDSVCMRAYRCRDRIFVNVIAKDAGAEGIWVERLAAVLGPPCLR